MRGGHVCVAGWSIEDERMVRPLHVSGHPHWDAQDDLFCPGNIISVEPSGHPPNRGNPHSTEDLLITGVPTLTGSINHEEMAKGVSGSVHDSVQSLFGDAFAEKKYIPDTQGLRSLGAVEVTSRTVRFYDNYDKLTCWFVDNDDETYTFKISCRALNAIYKQEGTEGLNDLKTGKRNAHIRLGLANPWGGPPNENWNPERCYAMVNGIIFI